MPIIGDRDASIFREASIPAMDNFTEEELSDVSRLARDLKTIMDAAKQRLKMRLEKKDWN